MICIYVSKGQFKHIMWRVSQVYLRNKDRYQAMIMSCLSFSGVCFSKLRQIYEIKNFVGLLCPTLSRIIKNGWKKKRSWPWKLFGCFEKWTPGQTSNFTCDEPKTTKRVKSIVLAHKHYVHHMWSSTFFVCLKQTSILQILQGPNYWEKYSKRNITHKAHAKSWIIWMSYTRTKLIHDKPQRRIFFIFIIILFISQATGIVTL